MVVVLRVVEGEAVAITIKPVGKRATGSCQFRVTSECDIALERLVANRFEVSGV